MDITQPYEARRADGVAFWMPPRPVLLTAAWMLLVAAAVSLRPILPVDETRYVSVAWEMWVRGDFLVPHLNGLPYSDKPPLLFWLFHLGWWFFGVNDWWPRMVPALFALANLALTARLARRLWPDRPEVARNAPAVLLGLLLWTIFTTMVMFDMLVAFCVLAALLGIEEARRRGGVRPWLQVGGALGIGILAKGPVVLLLPLLVAVLAPWWSERNPRLSWWAGLLGAVAVAAAIGLAWALPAAASGGPAYADAILVSQTKERMVHAFAHNRPWWWYLALLPGLLYPYSAWPPLWSAAFRRRALDPGMRFCLAWVIPGLIAFSLISGKQPHYLLPLMPAVALLASRVLSEPGVTVRRWHILPVLAGIVLLGGVFAVAPLLKGQGRKIPGWVDHLSPGTGVALLALAVASWVFFDRVFARRVAGPTLVAVALVLGLDLGFAEVARTAYDLEPVARYLKSAEDQGRPIAWVGDYHGQFHFLGRLERPFQEIPTGSESLWIHQNPRGKVVQDLKYIPPDVERAELTQPYRDDTLAVWGRDGIP
ncbi:MAG TPA: glycosyltransferase family 39 protein [Thermoanaerobaculia bacterium]|jgi:4-amino-4-deoxy-L-arabinose transferase-like glycosyltransferase|nr:glycosyltransferase family 39 protein [Thermoanaerobaculia bacterium]